MQTDLAVNPFEAGVRHMVSMAQAAEDADYSSARVADHFNGSWSVGGGREACS